MTDPQGILFAVCAVLALVGALGTVIADNPLRAAMSLLVAVMSGAGLYLSLHAELLASLQMIVYAVLTAVVGVAPTLTGLVGWAYGAFAAVLGAIFILCSIAVWRMPDGDEKMVQAKRMFAYSVLYLFVIFCGLLASHFAAAIFGPMGGLL